MGKSPLKSVHVLSLFISSNMTDVSNESEDRKRYGNWLHCPVDNFGTVVGDNPTPYGILALWAVNSLSIVYWVHECTLAVIPMIHLIQSIVIFFSSVGPSKWNLQFWCAHYDCTWWDRSYCLPHGWRYSLCEFIQEFTSSNPSSHFRCFSHHWSSGWSTSSCSAGRWIGRREGSATWWFSWILVFWVHYICP